MHLDELKNIVNRGESERAEFKKSTGQRTVAAKTVCAMLNGLGGFVIFGVTDKGEIVGQQVSVRTLEDIYAELHRLEPPAFPDMKTVNLDGGKAVAIYNDHLEITNPGIFHFGITPDKLTRPHESKPWNPIIANVFYRPALLSAGAPEHSISLTGARKTVIRLPHGGSRPDRCM